MHAGIAITPRGSGQCVMPSATQHTSRNAWSASLMRKRKPYLPISAETFQSMFAMFMGNQLFCLRKDLSCRHSSPGSGSLRMAAMTVLCRSYAEVPEPGAGIESVVLSVKVVAKRGRCDYDVSVCLYEEGALRSVREASGGACFGDPRRSSEGCSLLSLVSIRFGLRSVEVVHSSSKSGLAGVFNRATDPAFL